MAYMTISETDFERLWTSAGEWRSQFNKLTPDRLAQFEPTPGEKISRAWKMAYWFDTAEAFILAKNYLLANDHKFQEADDAGEFYKFVILTNYKRHKKGESWL